MILIIDDVSDELNWRLALVASLKSVLNHPKFHLNYKTGQVTDQLHLVLAVQVTLFAFGGFWILAALLLVVHKLLSKSRRAKRTPSLEPVEVKNEGKKQDANTQLPAERLI